MQAQRLTRDRLPHYQRGVTTLFAVLMMLSLLTFVAVVTDTGRLYLEKRSLQKNADLAAMETALLYCRDHSLDVESLTIADMNVLSASRNDFRGNDTNSGVVVTRNGNAVTVVLSYGVPASLFEQLLPSDDNTVNLSASATAKACEPTALLSIRSSIATVDGGLLNSVLGGLLGTTLNLTVGDWESLIDTNINLLSYFDALASEVGVTAGDYDSLLTSSISLADLLDVGANVLSADGASAVAVSALESISADIPLATPNINLAEILAIQNDASKTSLDVNLPLMQLVESSIQLANSNSSIAADVDVALGIADATVRLKVTEPAQTAIGNPDLAAVDPYGNNAIYVDTAQVKAFVSLDLPIVGALLNNLTALLSAPLVSDVSNVVNSLLSLNLIGALGDILCLVTCVDEKDQVDIQILASPRIDIAITAGSGEARLIDADCDMDGTKILNADVSTSVASVALGQFGTDTEDASSNVFSSDPLTVDPIPLIDIGTIRVRKTCVIIFGCSYQYQRGAGWTSDKALADRQAFAGGGIGLKLDTTILGDGPESLATFENNPDDTYLPDVKADIENSFQAFSADDPVASIASTLTGVELQFYEPSNGNLLGGVLSLVGATASTLVSDINGILAAALSPVLDPLVNELLDTLGVSLANAEVGAALTCENDKVRLTN
ncbi:pilus assembly protein TadG-related protein [Zhongshania arctica]|uniref:Pilus assembly protein TadG-related protein n=1 Tax=Zhongshania arctica TaxID=3238302 RepID=A0ABV3TXX0_9GAMM